MSGGLRFLLAPKSIAVIGASEDDTRVGGRPLRHLRRGGYSGKVYPVNPNRREVQGMAAYPGILEVPEAVDCAIVAIRAEAVLRTLRDCATRGVKSVVLFTSGFAEMGDDGRRAQDELRRLARETGMRILGPNCMGAFNTACRAYLTFTAAFVEPGGTDRSIAMVSQSGGLGAHLLPLASARRLQVSKFVTTGNECDIEIGEVLEYLAEDPSVKAILAYVEGIRSGASFCRGLAKAQENSKPVILLKVGKSAEAARIAASHTASIVGDDESYDAVFHYYGVVRARSIEEMLDVAYAFSLAGAKPGKSLGVVSLSGGAAVQLADLAVEHGLALPPLAPEIKEVVGKVAPFASFHNPADLTANVVNNPQVFHSCLSLLVEKGGFDAVLAFLTVAITTSNLVEQIFEAVRAARQRRPDCPLILCASVPPDLSRRYEEIGCLIFEEPRRAVYALAALWKLGRAFAVGAGRLGEGAVPGASLVAAQPQAEQDSGPLNEFQAKMKLREIGIAVPNEIVVQSAEEAARRSSEVGFPLAVKVLSADISHKTEVGGVVLNVDCGKAAADAVARISASVANLAPAARIEGFLLSRMISDGVECIVGVTRDPHFGPVVMYGYGGVAVEIFRDVVYKLAPISEAEAFDMIKSAKSFPLLDGHRGRSRADVVALASVIVNVSRWAAQNRDRLKTCEINPVLVLGEGKGAVALDALIEFDGGTADPPDIRRHFG